MGVVLPLLLGLGGYRLLDSLLGIRPTDAKSGTVRWTSGLGWMIALWCVVVLAGIFTGIGLRNGAIHIGPRPPTMLSLIDLDRQPVARVADLTIIAGYYDRLEMSDAQRRAIARTLSDPNTETSTLVSKLAEFFSHAPAGSVGTATSGYEIFNLRKDSGR